MDNKDNKIDHEHAFDGKQDRNFYQKPFDEVTDPLPQIDEQSAALSEKDSAAAAPGQSDQDSDETKDTSKSGDAPEINQQDQRDQGDSLRDWDAENNRSSRQK